MWTILEIPPQPFGECSICRKHNCGEYEKDGIKKQMWIHTPIEMDKGGSLVFGYQCVKSMSDNLGIIKEVIEKPVLLTPTDEQIGDYVRKAVNFTKSLEQTKEGVSDPSHILHTLDRNGIKQWMTDHEISFVPQWGEERLREEALKHV